MVKIPIHFLIFFYLHVPILAHRGRKIVIYGRFDIFFLKTAILKKTTIPINVYRAFMNTAKFFTFESSEK
ncbi:MAG: hypothetical protein JWR26_4036 [Pedosphaera sp.]|nr:hypothetical protein [Pedosphaera sp.]